MAHLPGGYSNVLPKIEQALAGQAANFEVTLELQPVDAFGERDEKLVQSISKSLPARSAGRWSVELGSEKIALKSIDFVLVHRPGFHDQIETLLILRHDRHVLERITVDQ